AFPSEHWRQKLSNNKVFILPKKIGPTLSGAVSFSAAQLLVNADGRQRGTVSGGIFGWKFGCVGWGGDCAFPFPRLFSLRISSSSCSGVFTPLFCCGLAGCTPPGC